MLETQLCCCKQRSDWTLADPASYFVVYDVGFVHAEYAPYW